MNKMSEIYPKNEFAVHKDKVERLSAKKKYIESLFKVQIIMAVAIDAGAMERVRWVEVRGEPLKAAAAKEFIKSLCNPQATQKMKYPRELHRRLVKEKSRIECESHAVLSFDKNKAQVTIKGFDNVMTTKARSALEQFITRHTGDPEHGFSPDVPRRLDPKLVPPVLMLEVGRNDGDQSLVSLPETAGNSHDAPSTMPLNVTIKGSAEVVTTKVRSALEHNITEHTGDPENGFLQDAIRRLDKKLVPPVRMLEVDTNGGGQSLGSLSETAGNSHDAPSAIISNVNCAWDSETDNHNSGQETQDRSRSQEQEQQRHHRSPSRTRHGFNSSQQRKAGDNSTGSDNNLRYIVIDGSNVAMAHGNDQVYSCRGIEIAVNHFLRRGHQQITAFVPLSCSWSAGQKYKIKDQHLLKELKKRGHLVFTPAKSLPHRTYIAYDDRFVIKLAKETGGIIVSNDNYRDLWEENPEWRPIIENRVLMFLFVGDLFMPPDDPLGRTGPHLDDFLRVTPLASNATDPRQQQQQQQRGAGGGDGGGGGGGGGGFQRDQDESIYVAVRNYVSCNSANVWLDEGDVVIVRRPWTDAGNVQPPVGWLRGRVRRTGKSGLFPAANVDFLGLCSSAAPPPNEQAAQDGPRRVDAQGASWNLEVQGEDLALVMAYLTSVTAPSAKKNIVNVTRGQELDGGIRAFQRTSFNEKAQLTVKFAGADRGSDNGGLSREFMRLVVKAIQTSAIFKGPMNCRQLTFDAQALTKRFYLHAGRILAYCLVHNGPMPAFLNQKCFEQLACHRNIEYVMEDVTDIDMREKLTQISKASGKSELDSATSQMEDVIHLARCSALAQRVDQKNELVAALIHFLLVERLQEAYEQLREGLSLLGVQGAIERHPCMRKAFTHQADQDLTAESVEALFSVSWSEPHSHRRQREMEAQTYWRDLLLDLEDLGQLPDLLSFATGLDCEPALGFAKTPILAFKHAEDFPDDNFDLKVPFANTCVPQLFLPLCENYTEFKDVMLLSIKVGAEVFTNA